MANRPPLEIHLIRSWKPLLRINTRYPVIRIIERPVVAVHIGCTELEQTIPGFVSAESLRMIHHQHERLTKFELAKQPIVFSTHRKLSLDKILREPFRFAISMTRKSFDARKATDLFPRIHINASAWVLEEGEYRQFKDQELVIGDSHQILSLVLDQMLGEKRTTTLEIVKIVADREVDEPTTTRIMIDEEPVDWGQDLTTTLYLSLVDLFFLSRSSTSSQILDSSRWEKFRKDYLNLQAANQVYKEFEARVLAPPKGAFGFLSKLKKKKIEYSSRYDAQRAFCSFLGDMVHFEYIENRLTRASKSREQYSRDIESFSAIRVIHELLDNRNNPHLNMLPSFDIHNLEQQFVWNGYRFGISGNGFAYDKVTRLPGGDFKAANKPVTRAVTGISPK